MKICIFGAASPRIDQSFISAVEELGEILARHGHSLVYGGGRTGLMGAAARGFKRGGGRVHGVIPTFFKEERIEQVNFDCDELTFTTTMAERKTAMENEADAFLVVPGGIGTMEEFFEALTLKQLEKHTKAIVLFNVNGYFAHLEEFMQTATDNAFINSMRSEMYGVFENCCDVVNYIENYQPKKTDWLNVDKK